MSNKTWDASDRFELIASLYYKRFGRLAPGKSEPVGTYQDSCDPENSEQYRDWLNGQWNYDLQHLCLDALESLRKIVRDYNNTYDADQCAETGRWTAAADVDLQTMREAEELVRRFAP